MPETEIRIDADLPKNIRNVRIAPIWSNQTDYDKANQHKVEVALKIKREMLEPYL